MRSREIRVFLILSLLLIIYNCLDLNQVEAQQATWHEIEPGSMIECSEEIGSGETIQYSVLVNAPQAYQVKVLIMNDAAFYEWWYEENSTGVVYEEWAITGELSTYEMQAPYSDEWYVVFYNTNQYDSANIDAEVHIGSWTIYIPYEGTGGRSSLSGILFIGGLVLVIAVAIFLLYRRRRSIVEAREKNLLEQGIQQLSVGGFDDAEVTFRTIVEQNPKSAIGWRYLGDVLVLKDNIPNARICHQTAVRFNPKYGYSSTIKSKTKVSGEPWTESTVTLDLTMKVQSLTKPLPFGIMDSDAKLFEQTLEQQQEKLKESPDDSELMKKVAETLYMIGRNRESAEMYGKLLAKTPDDWKVHDSLLMSLGGAKYQK